MYRNVSCNKIVNCVSVVVVRVIDLFALRTIASIQIYESIRYPKHGIHKNSQWHNNRFMFMYVHFTVICWFFFPSRYGKKDYSKSQTDDFLLSTVK